MNRFLHLMILCAVFVGSVTAGSEKIFVVERESNSVAVVVNDLPKSHIKEMHNMNHGVIKFYQDDGYLISRDGYVVRFDPKTEKKLNEYKTSKSAIGFVIDDDYVAIANYDDKSVDILTRDLKPIQKIVTGSRNVGIKIYKNYLIFSEMDNDKITVLQNTRQKGKDPHFKIFKEFENVGVMPFDAMIKENMYINGFFASPWFGVVDLEKMEFSKIKLELDDRKPVLKVPHFGFWSLSDSKVFIPAVGDDKIFVYTKEFRYISSIKTKGLPVFTSLSPDKKYLAVTFSGKDFPTIEIFDTKTLKKIKSFTFDGKVLHVRWSNEFAKLYVSVNDANKLVVIDTNYWYLSKEIFGIKKPSGIFIYRGK
ncbi:MAG: nitrite reductase [Epsilonproteobacteria bacterium]|nr:nitrite reductase [Campylobacterota bacterium]